MVGSYTLHGDVSLAEFRNAYPGVEVDLPEGQYAISATGRTKPTLAIAARAENGEPLTRVQTVNDQAVHYSETLTAGFRHSALRPDTAVAVIDSRTTIRKDNEADRQRLQFKTHDGFQRTGEGAEENSGVVELIVMQGHAVECTSFTFAPYQPLSFGDKSIPSGGLTGGETRYRPPETIKVNMTVIRGLRAVAAFRFAMAGNQEATTTEA